MAWYGDVKPRNFPVAQDAASEAIQLGTSLYDAIRFNH